jgi:hypothetical protein
MPFARCDRYAWHIRALTLMAVGLGTVCQPEERFQRFIKALLG